VKKFNMKPEWMTIPEAGREFFNVGENVSYAMAKAGQIPTVNTGRRAKVNRRMMEEKLKEITAAHESRDKKLADLVRENAAVIVFALRGMASAEGVEDAIGWSSEEVSKLADAIYGATRRIN
jgi:hypothetical protein